MRKPKIAANLARAIWRLHGRCENPNCRSKVRNPQLQGAHILGVGAHIRVCADVRNGFCLCSVCHRYYTDSPREFSRFITNTWAQEYYDALVEKARPGQAKIDWDATIVWLKEIKKDIESGKLTIAEARKLEV